VYRRAVSTCHYACATNLSVCNNSTCAPRVADAPSPSLKITTMQIILGKYVNIFQCADTSSVQNQVSRPLPKSRQAACVCSYVWAHAHKIAHILILARVDTHIHTRTHTYTNMRTCAHPHIITFLSHHTYTHFHSHTHAHNQCEEHL